ncbi:MAG: hypothetical protein HFI71_13005 [Lachnospiraceae bacterium]|nr:hypothetical protein [Lachnospiraceae bacterium]
MNKMLEDVHRDAIKKFKPAGEEDKKRFMNAVISVLECHTISWMEGLLVLEGYAEEKTDDQYLKRILYLIVDGREFQCIIEIMTEEYWIKEPQGTKAMVFLIYLLGAYYVLYVYSLETTVESLRTVIVFSEEYLVEFDKLVGKIVDQKKEIEKQREKEMQAWRLECDVKDKEAEKILHSHPVITNFELFEMIQALEEEIGKLPNLFIQKVINEMGFQIVSDCFYVFSDQARQKILESDDSFIFLWKKNERYVVDYVIGIKEHEEEELLGSLFVMSGTVKRLYKQEKQ